MDGEQHRPLEPFSHPRELLIKELQDCEIPNGGNSLELRVDTVIDSCHGVGIGPKF